MLSIYFRENLFRYNGCDTFYAMIRFRKQSNDETAFGMGDSAQRFLESIDYLRRCDMILQK